MDRFEEYKKLSREAKKYNKYFAASVVGFLICSISALYFDWDDGLRWAVGAVACGFGALWSLIETRHFQMLSEIHILPYEVAEFAKEQKQLNKPPM
jgi:hypothetical protein